MPTLKPFSHSPVTVLLTLICLLFVLLAGLNAMTTPPFESVDEASHYLYIYDLLQTGQLPIIESRQQVFASLSVQRHHPPLYYLLGAALTAWLDVPPPRPYMPTNPLAAIGYASDNNLNFLLHPPLPAALSLHVTLLRFISTTLGLGTLLLVYALTRRLSQSRSIGLWAAFILASIPGFIHISGSINNDNLVTFSYAAGIYCILSAWQHQKLGLKFTLLIGLILAVVSLSKITGLTLFVPVYGLLLLGAWQHRWSWRAALSTLALSFLLVALLAGWWYIRNWQLYGDPLALNATARIWGRGGTTGYLMSLFEAQGVWESFWFRLGQFNISGPDWLYRLYLPLMSLPVIIGWLLAYRKQPALRFYLLFLSAVCLLVLLSLVISTSRVNISQGRILYPALIAFIPLITLSLHATLRHLRTRWPSLNPHTLMAFLLSPLLALALFVPPLYLAPAYPQATILTQLPTGAKPIYAYAQDQAGRLEWRAYQMEARPLKVGDTLHLMLYIQGQHTGNPWLFVKALDPITGEVLGGLDTYPAMLPTASLDANALYAIPLHFRIQHPPAHPNIQRLNLMLGWHLPHAASPYLPQYDDHDQPLSSLRIDGPLLLNEEPLPALSQTLNIKFGNLIQLEAYQLSSNALPADEDLHSGDTLTIATRWRTLQNAPDDWVLVTGLLPDDDSAPALHQDAPLAAYPATHWLAGQAFNETRQLSIPPDTPPGTYQVYFLWYKATDGQRLSPIDIIDGSGHTLDAIYFVQSIQIR